MKNYNYNIKNNEQNKQECINNKLFNYRKKEDKKWINF